MQFLLNLKQLDFQLDFLRQELEEAKQLSAFVQEWQSIVDTPDELKEIRKHLEYAHDQEEWIRYRIDLLTSIEEDYFDFIHQISDIAVESNRLSQLF